MSDMTKSYLFLIMFLLPQFGKAQCDIPQFLWEAYEQDVKYLTIKRMHEVQSPDTQFVTIPQIWQDSILEGLAAIYNASHIPESDSVFNLYCVHDRVGNPVLTSFLIGVEEGTPMHDAWSQGILETGDTIVDDLLSMYEFELVNHTNIYTLFSTPFLLNTLALADSLVNYVEGVKFAEPNYIFGVAGRIQYTADHAGNRYFDFVFEWNDCFDGCDNYHTWSFHVDPDCNVNYLGFTEGGFFGVEKLPEPINCMLTGIRDPDVGQIQPTIFPNPVSDEFFFRDMPEFGEWHLVSTEGTLLMKGNLPQHGIPVAHLAPGTYIVFWQDDSGKRLGQEKVVVVR